MIGKQTLLLMSTMMFAAGAAIAAPAKTAAKNADKKPGKTSVAGIRTVFLQSPANPLVALRVFFQVGSVDDPKGKEGLAHLTADDAGQGRQQGAHLRRGAGRALPAGRADSRLRRQGIDRVRGDGPPRQPRQVRRSAGRAGADAALRRRRLHPQPPGRARLPHQDAARERRRGSGQAGDGDGDVPRSPLRPADAGDGRRPDGDHARRRAQAVRDALRARSPDHRRRGRLSRRLRRGVREALRRAARQGAAAAEAAARRPLPKANQLHRRREGGARARDLDRAADRGHPQGPRLLSADRGAFVSGRAPHVQRRADEPPARDARPQLRRLRLRRELHPGRLVDVPAAQHPAPAAALRALAAPGAAAQQPVRAARRALRDRQADPRRHPAGGLRA